MENIIQFSETRGAFMAAFFEAKKNIGGIAKTRENKHLNSKYANLSDYLDAIDGAIEEAGLMVIQSPGKFTAAGDMPMETRIEHVASGEFMVAQMEIHIDRKNAQGDGSGISYARRYHIGALFGLSAEDDDANGSKRKFSDYKKEFDLITDIKELKDEARNAFKALRGNETETNLISSYVAKREADLTMKGATGFNPAQPRNAGGRQDKAAAPEKAGQAEAKNDKPISPENF